MGVDISPMPVRHGQTPARRLRVAGKRTALARRTRLRREPERVCWQAAAGRGLPALPIPPFEFENWAVIALGGIPNKVQVGDMGVEGRIFPVFDNSPAIYGWVRGSESSQVPSGTKGPCGRPPRCLPSLTGL